MLDDKAHIIRSLSKLIALPLAIARDAGNMKNFQFGAIRPHPRASGSIGQYALHVQCPWRLVGSEGIFTGSADYYEPAESDGEVDLNDNQTGNLQRKRLGDLLRKYDPNTRSWVNDTAGLVVESVLADDCGGLELKLSGEFRLQILPCGSLGEDWRFFAPGTGEDHLVVDGGRVADRTPSETSFEERSEDC